MLEFLRSFPVVYLFAYVFFFFSFFLYFFLDTAMICCSYYCGCLLSTTKSLALSFYLFSFLFILFVSAILSLIFFVDEFYCTKAVPNCTILKWQTCCFLFRVPSFKLHSFHCYCCFYFVHFCSYTSHLIHRLPFVITISSHTESIGISLLLW